MIAVCIVDNDGHILVERNIRCEPAEFLGLIAPFREDLVVGAECVCPGLWENAVLRLRVHTWCV